LLEPSNCNCTMLIGSGNCSIYDDRPLDCRSFPVVPHFSLLQVEDVSFFLADEYCPLGKKPSLLPDGFVRDAQRMWRLLTPMIPRSWKSEYNSKNVRACTAPIDTQLERTKYDKTAYVNTFG
jgi:hypothetical protein